MSAPSAPTVLPASPQQEGEFRCTRGGIAGTNNFVGLRARGTLDAGRAQWALDELLRRHEVLRTALREQDGVIVQVVSPLATTRVDFDLVDVCRLASKRRGRALTLSARRILDAPFRLTRAPLLRATTVRLGRSDHVLCWAVPHTIWDAGAHRVFVDEFISLYSGAACVGDAPVRFCDVAAWERERADPRADAYWDEQLRGAAGRIELPINRDGAPDYVPAVEFLPVVSAGFGRRLARLATEASMPIGAVVTAAVAALLLRRTGQSETTFAVAHANRDRASTERVLGCLYDFWPVRVRRSTGTTFRHFVNSVGATMREAHAHALPGRRLLARLNEPCDVQLNFQHLRPPASVQTPDRALTFFEYAPADPWRHFRTRGVWWGAQIDVNLAAAPDATLHGYLSYNAAAFPPVLAGQLATALARGLQQLALAPDRVIA